MAKILIIEDDLAFGTMIQTWLRKKGFEVEKATSVGAALKLLQEDSQRDLILSDLRLPDHDGLTTLRWLHKQGLHIPFIVMTSYAEVQNAVLAMKSGANDYVAKPFHPDILLEKINEAIKQASSAPVPANSPATPTQQEPPQQTTTQPDEDEAPKYICVTRSTHPYVGTDTRSKRHRQGICGASHTRIEQPCRQALLRHRLWSHTKRCSGIRILRSCERRLYWSRTRQEGSFRSSQRRNTLPRRDGKPEL